MSTVVVPRSDVTADEVCARLRDKLPARYTITPAMTSRGFAKQKLQTRASGLDSAELRRRYRFAWPVVDRSLRPVHSERRSRVCGACSEWERVASLMLVPTSAQASLCRPPGYADHVWRAAEADDLAVGRVGIIRRVAPSGEASRSPTKCSPPGAPTSASTTSAIDSTPRSHRSRPDSERCSKTPAPKAKRTRWHRRFANNLLKVRAALWTFTTIDGVEPTNYSKASGELCRRPVVSVTVTP
jgi:hypothetical protein